MYAPRTAPPLPPSVPVPVNSDIFWGPRAPPRLEGRSPGGAGSDGAEQTRGGGAGRRAPLPGGVPGSGRNTPPPPRSRTSPVFSFSLPPTATGRPIADPGYQGRLRPGPWFPEGPAGQAGGSAVRFSACPAGRKALPGPRPSPRAPGRDGDGAAPPADSCPIRSYQFRCFPYLWTVSPSFPRRFQWLPFFS